MGPNRRDPKAWQKPRFEALGKPATITTSMCRLCWREPGAVWRTLHLEAGVREFFPLPRLVALNLYQCCITANIYLRYARD